MLGSPAASGLATAPDVGAGVTPSLSITFPCAFSRGGEFGTFTMFRSFGLGAGMNATVSTVFTGNRIAAERAAVTMPSSMSRGALAEPAGACLPQDGAGAAFAGKRTRRGCVEAPGGARG